MDSMSARPKLIIVDGNSLLYRAFFAMPYLSTSEGQPTAAVYGFTNMLLHLLEEERPKAMVVAWDAPGLTFRHQTFEEYKAHRPSTPSDLVSQMNLAREIVPALGIAMVEEPGYEADDLVGTIALKGEEAGYDVLIVTGDLDELQLINSHIKVLTTRRGVTDTLLYDRFAVEERFGIRPEQIPHFKALKGDPSDNIPGVKGIGDKTASRLLQQFGSVQNLLAHLEEVEDPRLQKALRENQEQILQALELATINTAVRQEVDLSQFHLKPMDREKVREIFRKLEFRSLLPRLEEKWVTEVFPAAGPPSEKAISEEEGAQPIEVSLEEWKGRPLHPPLAFQPSFHSTLPPKPEIESLVIMDEEKAVILRETPLQETSLLLPLKEEIEQENLPKIGHDLKPLYQSAWKEGIQPQGFILDTMIAGYLLNSNKSSPSLAELAFEHLNRELPRTQPSKDLLSKLEEEDTTRLLTEAKACRDLFPILKSQLERDGMWKLYQGIEHPLIPILGEMEVHGVLVDPQELRALSESFSQRLRTLEGEIYQIAGEEFNIGSPKQLQTLLFEKLKLPRGKKTKTGYSTGVEVLEELAGIHPLPGKILQWREMAKLKSTYVDALLQMIHPKTGRVHTSFNQAVTATGRLSSSNPNLQNIPVRTEEGLAIRRAFIAPPGHQLLSADYSQIELRILAHVSGEPSLRRAFEAGEDIHTRTAVELFGVSPEVVSPEMRRLAKTVNFGVLYGFSNYGLSRQLGIEIGDAQRLIQNYFQRMPQVKRWIDHILKLAYEQGYVTTLLGRRRYLPELKSPNRNIRSFGERAATNSPIQGTAADIIKLAMIKVRERLRKEGSSAKMILQVHDELVFEVPEGEVEKVKGWVREEMESAYRLSVPLKVEVKVGPNWRDMEE